MSLRLHPNLPPRGFLIFAPLEGVTTPLYREVIRENWPEWDILSTDFLRVPAKGFYPEKHLLKHFGPTFWNDPVWKNKTMFQILGDKNSLFKETASQLQSMGLPWLDLNLGCPANTVYKNGGGSFLLHDLKTLERIVHDIRTHFQGIFSCKIRVGLTDASPLLDVIKLLNDQGVDLITVHGRTRDDLYKNKANWSYIQMAQSQSQVPIVGNGDIWSAENINELFKETNCYGAMPARGAMKFPWMAKTYKENLADSPQKRFLSVHQFLIEFTNKQMKMNYPDISMTKTLKGVGRYLFDGLPQGEELRGKLLRSQSIQEYFSHIDIYQNQIQQLVL